MVREVSATTYKQLQERAKDGKLDAADREQLRTVALSRLKTVAWSEVKDLATMRNVDPNGGAMKDTLLAKVEAAVDEMKLAHQAAANAVPVATVAGA